MMWFSKSRLVRSSRAGANVDALEEAVSVKNTCVAAVVCTGTASILLADGSRLSVPQRLIERSGVLSGLANAAELGSPVLVRGRAPLHAWFRYLQLTERELDDSSWFALLRNLLVRAHLTLLHTNVAVIRRTMPGDIYDILKPRYEST